MLYEGKQVIRTAQINDPVLDAAGWSLILTEIGWRAVKKKAALLSGIQIFSKPSPRL